MAPGSEFRTARELPDHGAPLVFVADAGDCSRVLACGGETRAFLVPHPHRVLGACCIGIRVVVVAVSAENRLHAWAVPEGSVLTPSDGLPLPEAARFAPEAVAAADWGEWVTQDGLSVGADTALLMWHIPVLCAADDGGMWTHCAVLRLGPGPGLEVAAAWRFFEPREGLQCPLVDAARNALHMVRAVPLPGDDDDEQLELVTVALNTGERTTTPIPTKKNAVVLFIELGENGQVVVPVFTDEDPGPVARRPAAGSVPKRARASVITDGNSE